MRFRTRQSKRREQRAPPQAEESEDVTDRTGGNWPRAAIRNY